MVLTMLNVAARAAASVLGRSPSAMGTDCACRVDSRGSSVDVQGAEAALADAVRKVYDAVVELLEEALAEPAQ